MFLMLVYYEGVIISEWYFRRILWGMKLYWWKYYIDFLNIVLFIENELLKFG